MAYNENEKRKNGNPEGTPYEKYEIRKFGDIDNGFLAWFYANKATKEQQAIMAECADDGKGGTVGFLVNRSNVGQRIFGLKKVTKSSSSTVSYDDYLKLIGKAKKAAAAE